MAARLPEPTPQEEDEHYSTIGAPIAAPIEMPVPQPEAPQLDAPRPDVGFFDKDQEILALGATVALLRHESDRLRGDLRRIRQQRNAERVFRRDVKDARFLEWLTSRLTPTERNLFVAHRERRLLEHLNNFDELTVIEQWQAKIAEDPDASATI